MKCLILNAESLADVAALIPAEIFSRLMRRKENLYVIGAEFLGDICGALVFELTDKSAVLHSIYVIPEYRRLGLGTELIRRMKLELLLKNCRSLTLSYMEDEKSAPLYDFFASCGIMQDATQLSCGTTTLGEARTKLRAASTLRTRGNAKPLYELTAPERTLCEKFIFETTGEPLSYFDGETPGSFVCFGENKVVGLLLFSETNSVLTLDFCYVSKGNVMPLVYLFTIAMQTLIEKYGEDKKLDMLLSTSEAENLFRKLIGTESEIRTVISGSLDLFDPIAF